MFTNKLNRVKTTKTALHDWAMYNVQKLKIW